MTLIKSSLFCARHVAAPKKLRVALNFCGRGAVGKDQQLKKHIQGKKPSRRAGSQPTGWEEERREAGAKEEVRFSVDVITTGEI